MLTLLNQDAVLSRAGSEIQTEGQWITVMLTLLNQDVVLSSVGSEIQKDRQWITEMLTLLKQDAVREQALRYRWKDSGSL